MKARQVLASGQENPLDNLIVALERQGLDVVRSFDLRSSSQAWPGCLCQHHGTADCQCQYVVLLVYNRRVFLEAAPPAPPASQPATVTIHGRAEVAQVELVQDPNTQPDPVVVTAILAVLAELGAAVPVSAENVTVSTVDNRAGLIRNETL